MHIYRNREDIPADFGPSVVTIGNFDGVHIGHARVISRVVDLARENSLTSVAVSFDPHPVKVHRPEVKHHDIMGQESRQHFMQLLGLDTYVLLHYTLEFAAQSPEEFVKSTFVDALHARYVVIGDDVRFGRNNSGDLNTMRQLGAQYGFEVIVVEDLMADELTRCSSTRIRQLLLDADMEGAARLLGRSHQMYGEVVHGLARGRELGFPTANLALESTGFIPADGVYAGWLTDESGVRHPAAISVGTNPTFDGIEHRQVEAHVIDRPEERVEDFNLYGQHVVVEFVKHLRSMVAFTGIEALIEQMNQDVDQAREVLAQDAACAAEDEEYKRAHPNAI
ncbi:MAG: bifunctional riboflavin kinase/FAD synthetase [Rothia sp. (in: high G+C Gram-positive bacteria)]|uniref:bifunctional riboflavin kinase/FAD synthetase n=1 Tax=Rothia sp. (in: high G+C Gram-positive bacteria) TaxID=1885016 RepID=UPI0026DEF022|nr:bifunctional riboflavin kinase/FAD synthetase [Rothia sp. (in: high G+C Gram-positive bacteria)]MDO5750390.1 bifunctional riboflavin kinase/FAD synthetase [Rothia sp. (in: high G+C Gram-positive bacteria)]